jgi:hypothetical protein
VRGEGREKAVKRGSREGRRRGDYMSRAGCHINSTPYLVVAKRE